MHCRRPESRITYAVSERGNPPSHSAESRWGTVFSVERSHKAATDVSKCHHDSKEGVKCSSTVIIIEEICDYIPRDEVSLSQHHLFIKKSAQLEQCLYSSKHSAVFPYFNYPNLAFQCSISESAPSSSCTLHRDIYAQLVLNVPRAIDFLNMQKR